MYGSLQPFVSYFDFDKQPFAKLSDKQIKAILNFLTQLHPKIQNKKQAVQENCSLAKIKNVNRYALYTENVGIQIVLNESNFSKCLSLTLSLIVNLKT